MSDAPLTMTPEFDLATRDHSRRVVVLGSTGSIGTQALDVVASARQLRAAGRTTAPALTRRRCRSRLWPRGTSTCPCWPSKRSVTVDRGQDNGTAEHARS